MEHKRENKWNPLSPVRQLIRHNNGTDAPLNVNGALFYCFTTQICRFIPVCFTLKKTQKQTLSVVSDKKMAPSFAFRFSFQGCSWCHSWETANVGWSLSASFSRIVQESQSNQPHATSSVLWFCGMAAVHGHEFISFSMLDLSVVDRQLWCHEQALQKKKRTKIEKL